MDICPQCGTNRTIRKDKSIQCTYCGFEYCFDCDDEKREIDGSHSIDKDNLLTGDDDANLINRTNK